jgi:TolA-binding protein
MARSILLPTLAFSLLAGCTTTNLPPLAPDDPASADAPEAVTGPARSVLGIDDLTQRTHHLITARAQENIEGQQQQQPNQNMQNMPDMKDMPGMQH